MQRSPKVDNRTRKEGFFYSRTAQVTSGTIVGFVLGIGLRDPIVALIGESTFAALTSAPGLLAVLAVAAVTLFVGFTIHAVFEAFS